MKKCIEVLSAKTVPQLKDEAQSHGLPVGGRKAELVERIASHLQAEFEAVDAEHSRLAALRHAPRTEREEKQRQAKNAKRAKSNSPTARAQRSKAIDKKLAIAPAGAMNGTTATIEENLATYGLPDDSKHWSFLSKKERKEVRERVLRERFDPVLLLKEGRKAGKLIK